VYISYISYYLKIYNKILFNAIYIFPYYSLLLSFVFARKNVTCYFLIKNKRSASETEVYFLHHSSRVHSQSLTCTFGLIVENSSFRNFQQSSRSLFRFRDFSRIHVLTSVIMRVRKKKLMQLQHDV